MLTYTKYIDNQSHDWYDSSNLLYSLAYDNNGPTVTLKVVFHDGRTYRYRDVDKQDFISFRMAQSNGKAFGQYIRNKYKGERLSDTSKEKLEELRQEHIHDEQEIDDSRNSDLVYEMRYIEKTRDLALYLGGKRKFRGKEGEISAINLLKCMNIHFNMKESVDETDFITDENEDRINLND